MSIFFTKMAPQNKRVPPEDDTLVKFSVYKTDKLRIVELFHPLKLYKKCGFKACESRKAQFTISKRGTRGRARRQKNQQEQLAQINCVLLGYFEAGRRPKVRSIQEVCEELEAEPDAKRTNKNNFLK